jgi:hypothetical protein
MAIAALGSFESTALTRSRETFSGGAAPSRNGRDASGLFTAARFLVGGLVGGFLAELTLPEPGIKEGTFAAFFAGVFFANVFDGPTFDGAAFEGTVFVGTARDVAGSPIRLTSAAFLALPPSTRCFVPVFEGFFLAMAFA